MSHVETQRTSLQARAKHPACPRDQSSVRKNSPNALGLIPPTAGSSRLINEKRWVMDVADSRAREQGHGTGAGPVAPRTQNLRMAAAEDTSFVAANVTGSLFTGTIKAQRANFSQSRLTSAATGEGGFRFQTGADRRFRGRLFSGTAAPSTRRSRRTIAHSGVTSWRGARRVTRSLRREAGVYRLFGSTS